MSTTLNVSTIRCQVSWDFSNSTAYGSSVSAPGTFSLIDSLAQGSGADSCSVIYADKLTISTSGTTTLDLSSTTGSPPTNQFGSNVSFTKVRLIFVWLNSADTNQASGITVGGNANAWSTWVGAANDKVKVNSGGALFLFDPGATAYAVTDATGDKLDITNLDGSNTAKVSIVIVGE